MDTNDAAACGRPAEWQEAWPTAERAAATAASRPSTGCATAAPAATSAKATTAEVAAFRIARISGERGDGAPSRLHERLAIFVDHMEYHHEAQIIAGRMILKPIPEAGWFDGFRQTQTFYPDWYCRLSSNNCGAEYDTSCGIESGEPLAWE